MKTKQITPQDSEASEIVVRDVRWIGDVVTPAAVMALTEPEWLLARHLHNVRAYGRDKHFTAEYIVENFGEGIGLDKGDRNRHLREMVLSMNLKGFPICSDGKGFFYAYFHEEVRMYTAMNWAKARGLMKRIAALNRISDNPEVRGQLKLLLESLVG